MLKRGITLPRYYRILVCFVICIILTIYNWFGTNNAPTDITENSSVTENSSAAENSQAAEESNMAESNAKLYIINFSTREYHLPDCSELEKSENENIRELTGTVEQLEKMAFTACQSCKP